MSSIPGCPHVCQVGELAKKAGVQVLIRGTSTLRNLENYHKLMGKKQGTYLKSYGAFMKVGLGSSRSSSSASRGDHKKFLVFAFRRAKFSCLDGVNVGF